MELSSVSASAPTDPYPSSRQGWAWVAVLVVAYICSYLDRQILSLLVDPIRSDLKISDVQFSLLQGFAFAIMYSTFGLLAGSFVDNYSRRIIIVVGVGFWSLMTALCGFSRDFWQLFGARVGVGIGESTLSPAAYSILSDCFEPSRLARAMSVYMCATAIGAGLSLMVGGSLVALIDSLQPFYFPVLGQMKTWQLVFLLLAIPGLPIAALIWSRSEPKRIGRIVAKAPPWKTVLSLLAAERGFMFPFLAGMVCVSTVGVAVLSWSPAFLMRVYGQSLTDVGLQLGLITMVGMSAGLMGGAFSAELLRRKAHVRGAELKVAASGLALCAVAGIGLLTASDLATSRFMLLFLVMFSLVPVGVGGATLQSLIPNETRGRMASIYLLLMNGFGAILGPVVPALFTDYLFGDDLRVGTAIALSVLICASLGAILLFVAIRKLPSRAA